MNQNQQSQTRQWKEHSATSNNQRWEPQKQNFDPNNPPTLQGYFKGQREQTGPNGIFLVATIVTVNTDGSFGEEIDVTGGQVLDDRLAEIKMGAYICIQFEGKHPSKTPGRSYNVWKIFEDEAAIPYEQLGGTLKKTSPQATQNTQQANNNGGQNFNQNQGQNFNQNAAPVFNNGAAAQQNQFNQGNGQGQKQGQMSNSPVFNTGQVNGNPTVNQKPYNVPASSTQNTQQANNNGGQNFNQNAGGNNNKPIFTGGNNDNDDLPF